MKSKNPVLLKFILPRNKLIPPRNKFIPSRNAVKTMSRRRYISAQVNNSSPTTLDLLRPDDRRLTPFLILDPTLCLCFSKSVYQLLLCLTLLQHKSSTPTVHVGKLNSITATGQSYVISMQLKMTSPTKSHKSIFSIVITMSPSTVQLLVKSLTIRQ